ncbi:MAG TPA: hypothetical protein VH325_00330 [Bryobacteraceae bacterium]|nr:hypothetical protein [Bryobacteraceae bacterium]
MDVTECLSASDAARATSVLQKLVRHDISRWALTGGLAVEFHLKRLGLTAVARTLNDIDFIADSFDNIPQTLTRDFVFRHIHPYDPPAKTMLQCVEPDSAVRVDLFRAYGGVMSRAIRVETTLGSLRIVSYEDLAARTARLAIDLAGGVPIPAKHGRDFLRLIETLEPERVEAAWQDHRKPGHPVSFQEAAQQLRALIRTRIDLLISPEYSKDIYQVCGRCHESGAFRLADPAVVLGLLGYC